MDSKLNCQTEADLSKRQEKHQKRIRFAIPLLCTAEFQIALNLVEETVCVAWKLCIKVILQSQNINPGM